MFSLSPCRVILGLDSCDAVGGLNEGQGFRQGFLQVIPRNRSFLNSYSSVINSPPIFLTPFIWIKVHNVLQNILQNRCPTCILNKLIISLFLGIIWRNQQLSSSAKTYYPLNFIPSLPHDALQSWTSEYVKRN